MDTTRLPRQYLEAHRNPALARSLPEIKPYAGMMTDDSFTEAVAVLARALDLLDNPGHRRIWHGHRVEGVSLIGLFGVAGIDPATGERLVHPHPLLRAVTIQADNDNPDARYWTAEMVKAAIVAFCPEAAASEMEAAS